MPIMCNKNTKQIQQTTKETKTNTRHNTRTRLKIITRYNTSMTNYIDPDTYIMYGICNICEQHNVKIIGLKSNNMLGTKGSICKNCLLDAIEKLDISTIYNKKKNRFFTPKQKKLKETIRELDLK